MKPNQLPAWQAVRLLANRELSAEALMRACLDRIAEREAEVQAFVHLDADAALAQARAVDAGPWRGPLHGLPLGVKDLFDTASLPTGYGSPLYAGHHPVADAAAVALCREAGALLPGKTVTTEFAYFHPGATRNPRHLGHTPGGSSSGSAAAVADSMLPLALGTQTAASIIRPAAYCGVVGYKPTHGRVPRAGVKSLSDTLDTVGGFARSVRDVALLGAVLTGDHRLSRDLDGDPARRRASACAARPTGRRPTPMCRPPGPRPCARWRRRPRGCKTPPGPLPCPTWWRCRSR
jgi:Asp-tRNA(Asn)/Glu-tRNA(Gln) amidotransferase A subunit family amidase